MALHSKHIIGFFPGVWDLLHPGHVMALKEAKDNCDELIVGVNKLPNGKEPIMSLEERTMMINAIRWVDHVIKYEDDEALYRADKDPAYDVRFMGADHKETHHPIKAKVIKISRDHDYSTTAIRARISRG